MTGRKHDEDHAETEVLPGISGTEEPDTEATVVLGEDYRRRVEQGHDPERDRNR